MTDIKRRISRLEEKTGVGREEGPKQIEVCFVEVDGTVTGTMTIDIDQRRVEG